MHFKKTAPLEKWMPLQIPSDEKLEGRYVGIEKILLKHLFQIFEKLKSSPAEDWRYLSYGPFKTYENFETLFAPFTRSHELRFKRMVSKLSTPEMNFPGGNSVGRNSAGRNSADGNLVGYCSLLNIKPKTGSIEVGHIQLMPTFQKRLEFSEAVWLLAKQIFALGYRRFEWKCDASNLRSRQAAQRFGFSYEGVFRQHQVVKGRNRDTAWFSLLDSEWSDISKCFEEWLAPENFNSEGLQKQKLSALTSPFLARQDPLLKT